MRYRLTGDKKIRIIPIRVTDEEHVMIKVLAAQRGRTMTSIILEAIRDFEKNKN